MANKEQLNLRLPVGRLVSGDLYAFTDKNMQGGPLLAMSGPNKGQPLKKWRFAIAIPKNGEASWALTDWGAKIFALAQRSWDPQTLQRPDFAWKIEDGDDPTPHKPVNGRPGRKNSDTEGYPGNWIVNLSSTFEAPQIFRIDEQSPQKLVIPFVQADAINLGDYIEVYASVSSNETPSNAGMYVNYVQVCFRGYGKRITRGVDPNSVGFGQGTLPPGASATPQGSAFSPGGAPLPGTTGGPLPGSHPAGNAAVPGVQAGSVAGAPAWLPGGSAPGVPGAPVGSQTASTAPTYPSNPGIQPHPGFIQPPVGGAAIPLPPTTVPTAPVGPQMTTKAMGKGYHEFIAAGWNDAALREHGYMV